jgi:hypothetical protein
VIIKPFERTFLPQRRAPLQGFGVHVARPGGRRRRPGCPLRVAAPLGALVRPSYRRHGFADPSLPSPRLRGLPTGVPSRAGARDRSHRLRPLSGPASSCPGSDLPAGAAPPGVLFPFDVLSERVRITRGCLPRLVPSSRFLTSPTSCSPPRRAASRAAAVHGVPALRQGRLRRTGRGASPRRSRSLAAGSGSPSSEEQEVKDTTTPDLSKPALPGRDDGRRPDRGPGAFPSGALHPAPAAATGVAAIPPARFSPPRPPVREGRRDGVSGSVRGGTGGSR